jgi:hypothetical protein
LVPSLVLVAAGCDRKGADSDTANLVRSAVSPAADVEWRTSPVPRVRIGGTSSDTGAHQLAQVVAAHLLSDGRIVLANSGSSEMRWYDSTGRLQRATGRNGEGPGEFRLLVAAWTMPGDTTAAFDASLDRISVFSPNGDFIRSVKLESTRDLSRPNPLGHMTDGTIVGLGATRGLSLRPELVGKIVSSELRLARFAADGKFLNEIARLSGQERYVVSATGSVKWPFVPFSPEPSYAISGSNVLSTSGREFLIEERDALGRLRRRIRADVPVRDLTSEHRAEFAEKMRASARTQQDLASTERYLADAPYPRHLPVISRLLPTGDGTLWVQSHSPDLLEDPRWWVLDRTGHWIGYASTPRDLRILDIGSDRLVGVEADSLGVQSLLVYDLIRPARLHSNPADTNHR